MATLQLSHLQQLTSWHLSDGPRQSADCQTASLCYGEDAFHIQEHWLFGHDIDVQILWWECPSCTGRIQTQVTQFFVKSSTYFFLFVYLIIYFLQEHVTILYIAASVVNCCISQAKGYGTGTYSGRLFVVTFVALGQNLSCMKKTVRFPSFYSLSSFFVSSASIMSWCGWQAFPSLLTLSINEEVLWIVS